MVRFVAGDFSVVLSILSIAIRWRVIFFEVICTLTTYFKGSQGVDNVEQDNPQNAEDAKKNTEIIGNESHHRGAYDKMPLSNGTSLPPSRRTN